MTATATTTRTRSKLGTPLSKREHEVLLQISQGFSTKEISAELGISALTVSQHVAAILEKLGARNRAHAVAIWAIACFWEAQA